jgi:hypothetical protein
MVDFALIRTLKISALSVVHFLWVLVVFSLYVGAAVLAVPQDCLWTALLFGFRLFLLACFGVGTGVFTTRLHTSMLNPHSWACENA